MIDPAERLSDYGFGEIANAGYFIAFRLEFLLPEFEHNTLPRAWVAKYTQQGLLMLDPVMQWIYANIGSTRWSEISIPDSQSVLEQAAEYGLSYGAAISIRDADQLGMRSFGNFCRTDRELTEDEIEELQQKLELLFADLTAPDDVTEAELEVLRLIKAGQLIKEIAHGLSLSEGAVKQRLRSAKDKLGARTTPHAISVASDFGLI